MAFLDGDYRLRGSYFKYRYMFNKMIEVRQGDTEAEAYFVPSDNSLAWLVPFLQGKPYVVSLHDVQSLRMGECPYPYEVDMLRNATSIIATSQFFAGWAEHTIGATCPIHLIHLRPLAEFIEFTPLQKIGNTVIYAGGISPDGGGHPYRQYAEWFAQMIDEGIAVHVASPGIQPREYAEAGCIMHGDIDPRLLYRFMSQFSVGLQGYAKFTEYLPWCLPNKTWEYLGAGIPTLGFGALGNSPDIYVPGGWGVVKQDDESWREATHRALSLRITDELRFEQTMDRDIVHFRDIILELSDAMGTLEPHAGFWHTNKDGKRFFKTLPAFLERRRPPAATYLGYTG